MAFDGSTIYEKIIFHVYVRKILLQLECNFSNCMLTIRALVSSHSTFILLLIIYLDN